MGWIRWLAWVVVFGWVLASGRVDAQDATTSTSSASSAADAEAQLRFMAGRAAFEAGRYEDALQDFRRSLELSGRVELWMNIAEICLRLDRTDEERDALEHYLAESGPDAPRRLHAETRLQILRAETERAETERAESERAAEAARAAEPSLSPRPPPRRESDVTPWVLVGVSSAVAIVGAVLLGVAESDRASVESARPPALDVDVRATADRVPVLEGVGIAALALGAIGAVTCVVWGASSGGADDARVSLRIGPTGVLLEGAL